VHLEITTYSVIQFFIWMTVSIAIVSVVSYIYMNKKEKSEEPIDDTAKECNASCENIDNLDITTTNISHK
jgi:hypothetical protein